MKPCGVPICRFKNHRQTDLLDPTTWQNSEDCATCEHLRTMRAKIPGMEAHMDRGESVFKCPKCGGRTITVHFRGPSIYVRVECSQCQHKAYVWFTFVTEEPELIMENGNADSY